MSIALAFTTVMGVLYIRDTHFYICPSALKDFSVPFNNCNAFLYMGTLIMPCWYYHNKFLLCMFTSKLGCACVGVFYFMCCCSFAYTSTVFQHSQPQKYFMHSKRITYTYYLDFVSWMPIKPRLSQTNTCTAAIIRSFLYCTVRLAFKGSYWLAIELARFSALECTSRMPHWTDCDIYGPNQG